MPVSCSVFLNVKDINRSLEFYRALGFRVTNTYKDEESGAIGYADLAIQGAEISIGSIESNDDPEFRQWVSTTLGAGVIVTFEVPNVERYHKLAVSAKADIEHPPVERPYGISMMLNDPDGYSINFMQAPRKSRASPKKSAKKAATKKAASKKAGAKKAGAKKSAKKAARKAAPRSGRKAKGAAKKAAKKTAKKAAKRKAPARKRSGKARRS